MRLPIRVRLTAWYALLLAAILVALGAFVLLQFRVGLQSELDRETRQATVHIDDEYAQEGAEELLGESETVLGSDGIAQVIAPGGRPLVTFGDVPSRRATVPLEAQRAALAGRTVTRTVVLTPDRERFRAVVSPTQRGGERRVLVVAKSLADADASVSRVLALLLLAGPAALLATALGGWWLARRALLPVERMTAQAEHIRIGHLDGMIEPPRARDEVGRLAQTLNAMLARLKAGVEQQQRLIGDASHELRTPLAVMRAELDVSLRGDELTPAARSVLESARDETDHLARMLDNLLTLAQVDEGKLELLLREVDVREVVDGVVAPLESIAAAKRVRLDVGGEGCALRVDVERVHQALTNLVENAIKFSPPGATVCVTTQCGAGEFSVTVADEGPGLSEEAAARVFDRFYRVDEARTRAHGGSGLGLAIVREVAIAHGGRVSVESEPGRGSSFTLALPRGVPVQERAPVTAAAGG
jgi:heavy metal sensor kinase